MSNVLSKRFAGRRLAERESKDQQLTDDFLRSQSLSRRSGEAAKADAITEVRFHCRSSACTSFRYHMDTGRCDRFSERLRATNIHEYGSSRRARQTRKTSVPDMAT